MGNIVLEMNKATGHADRTVEFYVEMANRLVEAGFNCKARQKEALEALNRAYSEVRSGFDTPFELHNVRLDKHSEFYGDNASTVASLVELRGLVKDTPIIKESKELSEVEVKDVEVKSFMSDLLKKRNQQFAEGIKVAELFGGLDVHVNPHMVINHVGTEFVRCYYYLYGKLTPLAVIIAVAQELERKKAKAA